MPGTEGLGRWCKLAGLASLVLAIIPALLVYLYVERVPTMLLPVVASALPLVARTRRQVFQLRLVALVLLSLVVILGMMSVGRFFVPSAIAMGLACACVRPSTAKRTLGGEEV